NPAGPQDHPARDARALASGRLSPCFFDVRTRSVLSTNLKVRTTTCPTHFDPALMKASTSASASSMKVASFVEALEPRRRKVAPSHTEPGKARGSFSNVGYP